MHRKQRRANGLNKASIIVTFTIILLVLFLFAKAMNSLQSITITQILSNDQENSAINIENSNDIQYSKLFSKDLSSPLYDQKFPSVSADSEKAEAVKEAFLHAYNSYKKYCWKSDELMPISKRCKNTLNAGLTIVDSITTLYIMNLTDEYLEAREFISKDFKPNGRWSLFEFIIRFIGGFISIYQMSHDKIFLEKAVQCADAIYPLFDKETGFYLAGFTLSTDENGNIKAKGTSTFSASSVNLAEVGTYQLEFLTLTAITGDSKYMDLALKVYRKLWLENPNRTILHSASESASKRAPNFYTRHIGAGSDSYYEYIIKSYILTNGVSDRILQQHIRVVDEIRRELLFRTKRLNLTGIGVLKDGRLIPEVEHLATFAAGMIALGSVKGNSKKDEDMELATEIVETIAFVMNRTIAKLMPERVKFNVDKEGDSREFEIVTNEYLLRPESVESIFYLFRFTGNLKFREIAWDFFRGINSSCRVEDGFVSVKGLNENLRQIDIMDSWFLAETLNYLFLTFADTRLISPAEWVFNTESHPIHVWPIEISRKYSENISLALV